MKGRSQILFDEIDSVRTRIASCTVHFIQTLTVLTLNFVSGGDFRRYPEIKTSSSPISVTNLFGFWYLSDLFLRYMWSKHSTRKTPFHLNYFATRKSLLLTEAWGDFLIGLFWSRGSASIKLSLLRRPWCNFPQLNKFYTKPQWSVITRISLTWIGKKIPINPVVIWTAFEK